MNQALVICPAYITPENGRIETLNKALESVCNQTSRALALVVDDSSPFDVSQITSQFPQELVKYVRREKPTNENKTSAGALNYGIDILLDNPDKVFSESEKSRIKGVCYLHSDDKLPIDSIEKRLGGLTNGFVYGQTKTIGGNFERIESFPRVNVIPYKRIRGFPNHTIMWERHFLEKVRESNRTNFNNEGVFDTELYSSEDFVASFTSIITAYEKGHTFEELNYILYDYIVNSDSISGGLDCRKIMKTNQILGDKYRLGKLFFISETLKPMFHDFPFSLGHYLPEEIKTSLRPIRDKLKEL